MTATSLEVKVGPQAGRVWRLVVSWAAVGLAFITVLIIVLTTSEHPAEASQLSGAGFVILALSVFAGWSTGVGLAGLPVLAGAMIEIASQPTQDWLRATLIGCLWYVTSELAWDAIDRRDGHVRSRAFNRRRVEEVAAVVGGTTVLALVAAAALGQAPSRTFLVQVVTLALASAMVIAAAKRLLGSQPSGEG